MPDIAILFHLDKNFINTAGLLLATTGGCLLWYFVAEVAVVNKKGILAGEEVVFTIPSNTQVLRRSLYVNIVLSRIGVSLTVLGGVLQMVSNYMQ